MTAFWVWLHDHRSLRRALRAARRDLAAARRALAVSDSKYRAVQHLVRCAGPAVHIRLAHDLEQARARLGELEGVDPHQASLPLVALEVD